MALRWAGIGALALSLTAPASCSTSHCAPFSTLLWGGRMHYFGRANNYELRSTTHEDTANMVLGLQHEEHSPEVLVVLVLPSKFHGQKLSQDAFPSLHTAVTSSPSSKVIPCVTRSSASSSSVADSYWSSMNSESHSPIVVEHHELASYLTGHEGTKLFRNGRLDTLMATMPEETTAEEADRIAAEVSAALAASSPDGRYLVVQAPEFEAEHPVGRWPHGKHAKRRLADAKDTETYPKQYLYATPNLVAGLLTGAFFLTILWIAVQCLMALQTPTKWLKDKIPDGKQF